MPSPSDFGPVLVSMPEHDMRAVWMRMQGMEDALRMQHEVILKQRIQLAIAARPRSAEGIVYEVI